MRQAKRMMKLTIVSLFDVLVAVAIAGSLSLLSLSSSNIA